MKLLGFNFTKINAEKLSEKRENISINTDINIKEIHKVESDLFKSEDETLGISFNYIIDYKPNLAKIELSGKILIMEKPDKAKEIIKKWKKKEILEDFQLTIFNLILRKSNLKALQLEEEINIPLHISLPTLGKK